MQLHMCDVFYFRDVYQASVVVVFSEMYAGPSMEGGGLTDVVALLIIVMHHHDAS